MGLSPKLVGITSAVLLALTLAAPARGQTPLVFVRPPAQGPGTPGFQVVSDPTIHPFEAPGIPASITTTLPIDFQGSGRPDLLACYVLIPPNPPVTLPCRVLRPQADGSLIDVTRALFGTGALPSLVAPREIIADDFNGDGRVDVFIAGTGWDAPPFPGETNVLLISNPDGTYTDRSSALPTKPDFSHSACSGDVNGDGARDVYVGNIGGGFTPYFLLGHGDGTFTQTVSGLPPQIANGPEQFLSCEFVDVDRDGHDDLLLGTWGQGVYLDSIVLFNNGAGDFNTRPRYALPPHPMAGGGVSVLDIRTLDVNRDGWPDLLVEAEQVNLNTGTGLQVLINQHDGTFADETLARLGTSAQSLGGSACNFLAFADFNGDGWQDFYCNIGPREVANRYWISNGDGTWRVPAPGVLSPGSGFGIHAVDFDGDGRPDLVQVEHTPTGDVAYGSFLNRTVGPPGTRPTAAEVVSPAPESRLTASTVAFQWTGGRGSTRYWLHVGSAAGGSDLFSQDQGTNLRTTVTGLPTDGRALFVRLWSVIGDVWQFRDYSYTASSGPAARAELTRPAPGSTLHATTVTFQWTGGVNVSLRYLQVGTMPGGADLYNADPGPASLQATLATLPNNGGPVYVRLWSFTAGAWLFRDATYTATSGPSARAEMTSPAPQSTLTMSRVAFEWTGGTNVTRYWLYVGSTAGGADFFNQDQGTNLSTTVPGFPTDRRTLYVRLWSVIGSVWSFNDYTYTAPGAVPVVAELTSPAPASTLRDTTATFEWTGGVGVTLRYLQVGTTPGGGDVYNADPGATSLRAMVAGLPSNGSPVYVRLWSLVGGGWQFRDATYTAASGGPAKAELTSPAPLSTLTATSLVFEWTGGRSVTRYWLHVGSAFGATDLFSQDQGTNLQTTVPGLPADGRTLYVRLWSVIGGVWQFSDYTVTAVTGTSARGELTTPAPGGTLAASTVAFTWSGGTNVTRYWLHVGSTFGATDLLSQDQGTTLRTTVVGLPTDGRTLYVRLWSVFGGVWQFHDYSYTASSSP